MVNLSSSLSNRERLLIFKSTSTSKHQQLRKLRDILSPLFTFPYNSHSKTSNILTQITKQFNWASHKYSHSSIGLLYTLDSLLSQHQMTHQNFFSLLLKRAKFSRFYPLLGFCYSWGYGTNISQESAFFYYSLAANNNDLASQHELGWFYEFGGYASCNRDLERAFYWYQKSAKLGYAPSQTSLGECWHFGIGTEFDLKKAFLWYQRAACGRNRDAMRHLGECYEYGIGTKRDFGNAILWYRASNAGRESNGDKKFQNRLMEKGYENLTWFIRQAKIGDSKAQRILGDFFCTCMSVSGNHDNELNQLDQNQSPQRAFTWYKLSSSFTSYDTKNYNIAAKKRLALCYRQGIGTKRNLRKAMIIFREIIQNNNINYNCNYHAKNTEVEIEIAKARELGIGLERDLHESIRGYLRALRNGGHGNIIVGIESIFSGGGNDYECD
ncbi:11399_t:CDS:1 [Ambispora gerdemannii]|uniref:11399_t:CDS:1 n=1 Tax=Ambispora gerdemannii TaxID=144530 RepID=A0A9N8YTM6_9GLOM|nr:11399_t:CDS:1 [Ambispora gerdemannii]